MGRHSAPDDEDQDLDVSGTLTAVHAEDSPPGSTPRPGGRHSRGDLISEADRHETTELFRPYTGDFGAPASGDPAEAQTGVLPAVIDDAPSAAMINGTDTADLGAPVDAPLLEAAPAAEPDVATEPTVDTATEPTVDTATEPPPEAPPETASAPTHLPSDAEATSKDAGATGTRADLALLRTHPGLRARAAAAVLTPFVLYLIVIAVLGRFDQALLWVWIPIILAGVAFGLVLDLAQRARDRQRTDAPDSSAP